MERSPFYPFPTRPGYPVGPEAEGDRAELTQEQLKEVVNFEHSLFDLDLDSEQFPSAAAYREQQDDLRQPIPKLESVWQKKINSFQLGINYFLTDEGKQILETTFPNKVEYDSSEDCANFLALLDISQIPTKALDKLEADSIGFEEEFLTELFVNSGFDGGAVPTPQIITLFRNPEVIVQKAKGYRQIKQYLKLVRSDLREAGDVSDPVQQAKKLIVNLYKTKVNHLLASTYVQAQKFLAQAQKAESAYNSPLIAELSSLLPAFSVLETTESRSRFLQNLDRYRHGVDVDEQGQYTWLSSKAGNLAAQAIKGSQEEISVDRGVWQDIDPEILNTTEIDGRTYGDWIETVVGEYGLLSEYKDWDSAREGSAPDDKWQVIVNDKFKSLSVNSKQKVIKVPLKNRTLLSALVLANHEITHLIQNHNKEGISDLSILEDIGVDSALEQAEAGAKWQENEAKQVLSGKVVNQTSGLGYMKALGIKARGGSYGDAVEAYYAELLRNDPAMKPEEASAQAINRVRRIFRAGGFEFASDNSYLTNTQPLNYLEQHLIYEGLNKEQRKLLFVGGISLANLTQLISKGIMNSRKIFIPQRMPVDILYAKTKEFIQAKP